MSELLQGATPHGARASLKFGPLFYFLEEFLYFYIFLKGRILRYNNTSSLK
jgi:hypothetical protein